MGSGSIEERDGRHRVRVRVAGRKRTLGTYATHAEAAAVLEAALEQLSADRTASPGATTLRDWIARWLEQRHLSGVVRSVYDDESRLRAHVLSEPWADDALDQIDRRTVRAWAISMLSREGRRHAGDGKLVSTGRRLSRHTVSHVLATLRVCLRDAVELGLLDENPAAGVRVPAAQYTHEPWTYLTQGEIDALLSCELVPAPYRLLYRVAIYTGLRKGELWGLRWGDCYLDHATPHLMVRRSRSAAPKNGKIRMVPLLGQAREALEQMNSICSDLAPDRSAEGGDRSADLVFPAPDGSMRARWNDARWKQRRKPYTTADGERRHITEPGYRELAGIKRHVRFHDLRHTCASHLLMGTWGRAWRLEEVRDLLGHSDTAVTQRYAHLAPDRLHAAAAATVLERPQTGPTAHAASTAGSVIGADNALQSLDIARGAISEIRTRDRRFTKPVGSDGRHGAFGPLGLAWGHEAHELAIDILRRAARGDAVPIEAAHGLAQAVASHKAFRLAAAVLAELGQPTAQSLAVTLAVLVTEALERTPEAGHG